MNLALHRRRVSVAIVLVTLAVCAGFVASGATNLMAGLLLPLDPAPIAPVRDTDGLQAPGAQPPDKLAILQRNIFDPETGPLPKPPEPEVETSAEPEPPPEELVPGQMPPPCEGTDLKLVAAVHSDLHPDWSIATVSTGGDEPRSYRKGGRLEENEVVEIYPRAVFLRQGNGRFCSLSMFAADAAAASEAKSSPARPKTPTPVPPVGAALRGSGNITEDELNQNVTAVSETKFKVERSFVDKVLKNQAAIMRSARIVPHQENGNVVGVKLYGIRRNSLLGKLGMQNGDLLKTINGFDMSSPDAALEAYSRLRSSNNLAVSVTRRGRPVNLEYDIQ